MPGPSSLDEKQFELLFPGQANPDCPEHLLGCLEVQVLRLHQHAVVIPKDGLDHPDDRMMTQGARCATGRFGSSPAEGMASQQLSASVRAQTSCPLSDPGLRMQS